MSKVIELAKEAEAKISKAEESWKAAKTQFRSSSIQAMDQGYKGSIHLFEVASSTACRLEVSFFF